MQHKPKQPMRIGQMLCVWGLGAALGGGAVMAAGPSLPGGSQPLPPLPSMAGTASDQRLVQLEQQVKTLQAQVAALQSVLQVTPKGVTLEGGVVTIASQAGLIVRSGGGLTVQSQAGALISSNSELTVQSTASMNLRGAVVKFNGGSKPLAVVGSQVTTPQGVGQVVTGSPTVLGD